MKYLSKEYLEEERTPKLLVIAISFYVLSFLLVILRLASRRIVKAKLWWDDVLIIFALIVLSVPLVTSYYGM